MWGMDLVAWQRLRPVNSRCFLVVMLNSSRWSEQLGRCYDDDARFDGGDRFMESDGDVRRRQARRRRRFAPSVRHQRRLKSKVAEPRLARDFKADGVRDPGVDGGLRRRRWQI
ncbi:hypothetical protein PHJA_001715600 [Phtheirospermum japonicum]|uniref:Uncharacterized protein n=1 Tax=Phtheirospermum japonicum TaxID=374723 RepID=A0A830CH78_9LAMI|nr:hypothetical protein PHJA_001715600 [Phtheirospermum japonicum]